MIREALTFEKLRSLPRGEAAALFIARRAEGLTPSEAELLSHWLGDDELNRREFERTERAWDIFADPGDDELLAAMRSHALASRKRSFQWPRLAAAAAAFMILLSAGLMLLTFEREQPPSQLHQPPIQYASVRGEVKVIQLPDGSSMTLDADSAATGRFTEGERTIELTRGRAYFAVLPDTVRPFAVTAADRRVVAIGTRFDVGLAARTLTVTLLEGRVSVGPRDGPQRPVILVPGQQFVESNSRARIVRVELSGSGSPDWSNGLVSFNDQPLAEAVEIMNRYSQDRIIIRDSSVAGLRVSGQFRAGDADRFAEALGELHAVRAVRRPGEIELVPAG